MLIRYRVLPEHVNTTIKGQDAEGKDIVLHGSVHHPELTEFTGLITRSTEPAPDAKDAKPTYDIVIFPPGLPLRHVNGVEEGPEPGQLQLDGKKYPKAQADRAEADKAGKPE